MQCGVYLYHSGWGYDLETFRRIGGYPYKDNGEDKGLLERFGKLGIVSTDPVALGYSPFLVYPWDTSEKTHFSSAGPNGYRHFGRQTVVRTDIQAWIADPAISLAENQIVTGIKPRMF
jgi:hypothetical protein